MEAKKGADDDIGETSAAQYFPADGAGVGDAHWSIVVPFFGSVELAALREGALVGGGFATTIEVQRILPVAEVAKAIHGLRRPASVGAHGAVIRAVGAVGSRVLERLCAHPVFHQQLADDEVAHLPAHAGRKVLRNALSDKLEIETVAHVELAAIRVAALPIAFARHI